MSWLTFLNNYLLTIYIHRLERYDYLSKYSCMTTRNKYIWVDRETINRTIAYLEFTKWSQAFLYSLYRNYNGKIGRAAEIGLMLNYSGFTNGHSPQDHFSNIWKVASKLYRLGREQNNMKFLKGLKGPFARLTQYANLCGLETGVKR